MKKSKIALLAGVVVLAGLLGGCQTGDGRAITVEDPEFQTNWVLEDDGRFVVCGDRDTVLQFSVYADPLDALTEIRQFFVRTDTGEELENHILGNEVMTDEDGRVTVSTTFGPGVIPASPSASESDGAPGSIEALDSAAGDDALLARYEIRYRWGETIMSTVWGYPTSDEDYVEYGGYKYYEVPVLTGCTIE